MQWSNIRDTYPDQWLIVEALDAHTTPDSRRHLDRLAVIEHCQDGSDAMESYRRLHRRFPGRELYFVHTSREELDIEERRWLGIRGIDEADAPRLAVAAACGSGSCRVSGMAPPRSWVRPSTEPETTGRNLGLIREARAERGEDVAWLDDVIAALEEKTGS